MKQLQKASRRRVAAIALDPKVDAVTLGAHGLRGLVPAGWQASLAEHLASPGFRQLESFIAHELAQRTVMPPVADIFAALAQTPLDTVKVVLLGQDPYPTPGVANGLAFSVAPEAKVPASLRNLFAAVQAEYGSEKPLNGDLTRWARQGVLLTNVVWTVRALESNSHQGRGWEAFTSAVLDVVSLNCPSVVFVGLGKKAEAVLSGVKGIARHGVVLAPHPSPLNGSKFAQHVKMTGFFRRIEALLDAQGIPPIVWTG